MIGILDTNAGGLSLLGALLRELPDYEYLFYADTKYAPYESKSGELLQERTEAGLQLLQEKGAKLILVSSFQMSVGAREVLEKYQKELPILDVATASLGAALAASRFGRIGIIGPEHATEEEVWKELLRSPLSEMYTPIDPRALKIPTLTTKTTPLLSPLIEARYHDRPETRMILKKYLHSLKHTNIDTLIPAAGDYILMNKDIQRKAGKRVQVIDSVAAQLDALKTYLETSPLLSGARGILDVEKSKKFPPACPGLDRPRDKGGKGGLQNTFSLLVSDHPERFREQGHQMLGRKIGKNAVQKV